MLAGEIKMVADVAAPPANKAMEHPPVIVDYVAATPGNNAMEHLPVIVDDVTVPTAHKAMENPCKNSKRDQKGPNDLALIHT